MTAKQKELKKHLIKVCHTLKSSKFPDDDIRKDYLFVTYGKTSMSELSIDQLKEFAIFLGYGRAAKEKKPFIKDKSEKTVQNATQSQIDTIEGVWFRIAREPSDFALRNYIHRITGMRPLYLRFLSRTDAQKVITGLLKMQEDWNEKRNDVDFKSGE
ncbi:MAG: DUF1018 domain-containing protein [Aliarcobacter sp.]|nr:DUF1018 domain-containing protein [Aliarcobacter sp.]